MLNVAGLVEDGQLDRMKDVCEDERLPIVETGDVFLTTAQPTLDASRALTVTESVLSTVYGRTSTDIVEIRERKL